MTMILWRIPCFQYGLYSLCTLHSITDDLIEYFAWSRIVCLLHASCLLWSDLYNTLVWRAEHFSFFANCFGFGWDLTIGILGMMLWSRKSYLLHALYLLCTLNGITYGLNKYGGLFSTIIVKYFDMMGSIWHPLACFPTVNLYAWSLCVHKIESLFSDS